MRISDWSSDVCSSDLSLARVVLAVPGEIVLACLQRADRDGPERLAGGILDRDAGVGRTFGNVDLAIDRAGRILDGGRARCERIFAYQPGRRRTLALVNRFQTIADHVVHLGDPENGTD